MPLQCIIDMINDFKSWFPQFEWKAFSPRTFEDLVRMLTRIKNEDIKNLFYVIDMQKRTDKFRREMCNVLEDLTLDDTSYVLLGHEQFIALSGTDKNCIRNTLRSRFSQEIKECLVCFEEMDMFMMCKTCTYYLCSKCYPKIDKCPQCREFFE